jgi:EmrB/QacA subfamily drug resistance transporter
MPTTRTVFWSFVAMLVLAALDQTILSTALPAIARELQERDRLSWLFSAYLMAATVAIPLYGRLADMHGSRPLLLLSVALFLLGSAACGFSARLDQLIVARAIQGAGGGGLLTLTLLAVAELVPPQRRGPLQGLLGASYGVATMFGPLIGATLVEHLSWRWAFFINMPVAAAAWAVIALGLPRRPPRAAQRVDAVGVLVLAAALVSLLLATRHGAMNLPLLVVGAALAALFLWTQQRTRWPILPLALFSRPAFSAAAALSAISGVALFSVVVFLPTYLQTVLLLTPTASAWHLLPLMAGITFAAVASGRRLRRNPPVRSWALGACALVVLSGLALAAVFRMAPTESLAFSAGVLPMGLGIGTLFPLITMVSQRSAPAGHMGVATSTPIMLRSLGGALGVSALAALLGQGMAGPMGTLHAAYGTAYADAAQAVYLAVAAMGLMAAWATVWLPARPPALVPLTAA